MSADTVAIRQTTVDDIPDLVRLRRMMFETMRFDDPAQLDTADAAAEAYFAGAIPAGEFYGWLAEQNIQHMTLHATEMGRSLYEELGFIDSNEMRLRLE